MKPIKCVFYKQMPETLKQYKDENWDSNKLEPSQFAFYNQGHK